MRVRPLVYLKPCKHVMRRSGSEGSSVRVVYDRESDTLTIILREDRIRESDEITPGVIADLGYGRQIVRLEILRASQSVDKATEMQFAVSR